MRSPLVALVLFGCEAEGQIDGTADQLATLEAEVAALQETVAAQAQTIAALEEAGQEGLATEAWVEENFASDTDVTAATEGLATQEDVTAATEGLATQEDVTAATEGLATEDGVAAAIDAALPDGDLATEAWVTTTYATSAEVDLAIDAALPDGALATQDWVTTLLPAGTVASQAWVEDLFVPFGAFGYGLVELDGRVELDDAVVEGLAMDAAYDPAKLTLALDGHYVQVGDVQQQSCDVAGALAFGVGSDTLHVCDGEGWLVVFERIPGSGPDDPGESCHRIKTAHPSAADGPYWLEPPGYAGGPFETWCDMTTDGGGWTMVGKVPAAAHDGDGGILDGFDTTRWIDRVYLGEMTDLESEAALGPAYESVAFTDFLFVGLNDPTRKLAWRHATPFTSLLDVFSSSAQHRTTNLLVGDFRSLDYRSGCTVGGGPDATGPQFYGFNINGDSYTTGGTLVSGYTGGWCAALAGYGRDNQTTGYSGGGLGAICQGRGHQMGRHYWGHGDACAANDWTGGSYQTFEGHAFFVR